MFTIENDGFAFGGTLVVKFRADGYVSPEVAMRRLPQPKQWKKAWIGQPHQAFREYIAAWENSAAHLPGSYGYLEHTGGKYPALGRYQIQSSMLHRLGLKAAKGRNGWGKTAFARRYGIKTDANFLNNEDAQENAMSTYLDSIQSDINPLLDLYGNQAPFQGVNGDNIKVTEAGLAAAIHREGGPNVRKYFSKWAGVDTFGEILSAKSPFD